MELAVQLAKGIDILKLEYPVVSKSNVKKLHDIIVAKGIDVLINQWGLPFKTTMLCNRAIKGTECRLVSVLHGSPYTSKIVIKAQDRYKKAANPVTKCLAYAELKSKEAVIKWSIRYNIRHNQKYILLSNAFINPLLEYAHVGKASNLISIGNPITIDVNLKDFNLGSKKKHVLYVGRMDFENKRVNRIVDAWKTLYPDFPEWELVLVGDGPHKQELMSYVEKGNIERVKFEGFKKDPPIQYYKDASIFMLTSDLEGFGLVIVESMAYGVVPIVYGSYEAVYDIIDNDVNGFITPQPYSNERTVEKLKELMTDETKRNSMAKAAMDKSSKFSLDSVIAQWYQLFDEIR
jgi:glycosyltransferase involved in cell wall biosynthesis